MALDHILVKLTKPQQTHAQAVHLGRLGFLEWLASLPDDEDLQKQALVAYARASPMQVVVPAVGVLCKLLQEASHEHADALDIKPKTLYERRASRRRRRRRRH